MARRGRKPKGKRIEWTPNLAYAIGLLVTDGCLSNDGRHIIFVSSDAEQLRNIMHALNIEVSVGATSSGYTGTRTPRIQFGNVILYSFLLSIGLMPNKTKIIREVQIPPKYFWDFLRGHLDGDGTFYSYWDPRWKSSFMFYTTFVSASEKHITWLRSLISRKIGVEGHVTRDAKGTTIQLKYAKADSLKLLKKVYYQGDVLCLRRKRLKIEKALRIIGEQL
ncbi:hypothetical protein HYW59_04025 [Candidatus Kaiserbacteria bacterium]|nr:hypothetical protein [Candidatus Kaiserbacteria bacterium]